MLRYLVKVQLMCCVLILTNLLFAWWIIPHFTDNRMHTIKAISRDMTCLRHDCHKHGTCLLGKCFCHPIYDGIDCEITSFNGSSMEPCINNDRCFFHPLYGIGEVSVERWNKAISAEQAVWANHRGFNDRWDDHLSGFNNYKILPNYLGNMLEIGCGPYTQTLSILRLKNKHVNISQLTLSDPNVKEYMTQVKRCSYKNGTLTGFEHISTTLLALKSEEMSSYTNKFDTILMINVLEHAQNAYQILQNLYNALKTNGILIFAERWWDHLYEEKSNQIDILHPIRIKFYVWKWFTDHFIALYDARNHQSFLKHGYNGSYFIGRKKINASILK